MEVPARPHTSTAAANVAVMVRAMHAAACPEDAVLYAMKAREWVERAAPRFIDECLEGYMRRLFADINAALLQCAQLHWRDYHYAPAAALGEDDLLTAMLDAMEGNNTFVAVVRILDLWAANPDTLARLRQDHPLFHRQVDAFLRYWHAEWPLTRQLMQ